ncbi:MAG: RnfABCDGE type electron transport complex subunit D [Spirochaetes bacterium]|nr:RnfABCDGE type electron transport complex subunit D [Spirochaetota bacterium]MBU1082155.1 RnfABCDGE type electron transport complex subunit D [Spirochaetota bacterium]
MSRDASASLRYPPYIHDWKTSAKAAWICSITLAPVVAWSIVLYGRSAALVWLVSVASALASEAVASGISRRWTLGDGSAALTGLLIATAMPPGVPLYVPALSAAFAVLVVKAAFGGLGANWMNPALAGIAFAYANWPVAMREYVLPRIVAGVDGVSAATPLTFAKGLAGGLDVRIMDSLRGASYPLSSFDSAVTGFLNDSVFSRLGARLPDGYIDLAIGLKPGALGESALIAVLVGSLVLVGLRLIKPVAPIAMVSVFAILARVLGTGLPGEAFLNGDALFSLGGGSVLLVAFYMAADPVSSPVRRRSALVYGAAIGALCFVFRRWGAYSEGAAYSVLVMNVVTPFIEKSASGMTAARARRRSS